jgi:hypothetical protein
MSAVQVRNSCAILILTVCLLALAPTHAYGQPSVLTYHNDKQRTGQNLNETILTPANVNAASFGKLFVQPVDGSIVGQPLYVPHVQLPDGTIHNVVYVTTLHDSVYAFDADNKLGTNANPLWAVNYPKSIPEDAANYGCTTPGYTEVGIVGTPVVDPNTDTLYVVSKTLETGQYYFRLHALDLASGAEKFGGPTTISASVQVGNNKIVFTPSIQLQRPALLLWNGVVYIGFGSNGCDTFTYHGWLLAYSASTLQPVGTFITTPQGKQGSIWEAGGGPAVDSQGFIYFSTANGTFDFSLGGTDFGDSFLKLSSAQNGFKVQDYFTPFNQATLDSDDLDLGSGGVMVLPDQNGIHQHEIVGGGKQGTLYLVDRDAMGGFNMATDMVVQEYPALTSSIKTTPAYWNGNVYLSGQKDYIKMFSLNGGSMSNQPVQQTSVIFNDRGPTISISANGTNNGILWAVLHGTPVMYAFDATNLSNELYDTTQAKQLRDKIPATSRYVVPTVVNGKVFVGGLHQLDVFGLLPNAVVTSGNNQSAAVGTTLSVPLTIQTTDAYSHAGIPGVPVTCKDGGANGKLSSPMGVTDSTGKMSTNYTLPPKARVVTITCMATGYVSGLFTETAVPGPAATFREFSGTKQTAPVNTLLPQPLVVKITDIHFNAIQGAVVTFSDGGKSGSFSSTTAATDVNGLASVSYTTPGTAGVVKITATMSTLPAVTFSETVTSH